MTWRELTSFVLQINNEFVCHRLFTCSLPGIMNKLRFRVLLASHLTRRWVDFRVSVNSSGEQQNILSFCQLEESSWNVMAHGDVREGKWRGNWRIEWVASTLHTTSEHGLYPALLPLMRTPRLPVVDWTDAPRADLNGLVRFAERWNLISARVPSHFKRSLHISVLSQLKLVHTLLLYSCQMNLPVTLPFTASV